jgi:hypothetical protein
LERRQNLRKFQRPVNKFFFDGITRFTGFKKGAQPRQQLFKEGAAKSEGREKRGEKSSKKSLRLYAG